MAEETVCLCSLGGSSEWKERCDSGFDFGRTWVCENARLDVPRVDSEVLSLFPPSV